MISASHGLEPWQSNPESFTDCFVLSVNDAFWLLADLVFKTSTFMGRKIRWAGRSAKPLRILQAVQNHEQKVAWATEFTWNCPPASKYLVEDGSQTAESSADQKCQQSSKERVPWEGPAEEEGCAVEQKKHQSGSWKSNSPKIKSYSEKFGCLCEDFETHLHFQGELV